MYILIDEGGSFLHVEVPSEFDAYASDIIRYLGVISRTEHVQPCSVVTYSMTELLFEEDEENDWTPMPFHEFMRPEDFVSVLYGSNGSYRVVPNPPFWDGLPEKVMAYLLRAWAGRESPPKQLFYLRQFQAIKWPKKVETPVPKKKTVPSRFKRKALV